MSDCKFFVEAFDFCTEFYTPLFLVDDEIYDDDFWFKI